MVGPGKGHYHLIPGRSGPLIGNNIGYTNTVTVTWIIPLTGLLDSFVIFIFELSRQEFSHILAFPV